MYWKGATGKYLRLLSNGEEIFSAPIPRQGAQASRPVPLLGLSHRCKLGSETFDWLSHWCRVDFGECLTISSCPGVWESVEMQTANLVRIRFAIASLNCCVCGCCSCRSCCGCGYYIMFFSRCSSSGGDITCCIIVDYMHPVILPILTCFGVRSSASTCFVVNAAGPSGKLNRG